MEFDPSELTYLTYFVENDPLGVILPFGDSSVFRFLSCWLGTTPVCGLGLIALVLYPGGVGVPGVEDVEIMHPMALGMDIFRSTDNLDSTCRVKHDDSSFC